MTVVAPASPALIELLAEAEAAGLRLRVSAGDSLVISGQPGPALLARLSANKAAVVALLRAAPPTPGATP
jgi:hypothetical protein